MGRAVSLLFTLAAALVAALIVVPAPSKQLAFAAVVVGEKSFLVGTAATLGLLATWWLSRGRRPFWRWSSLLLAAAAVLLCLYPFAQAAWMAASREVNIDLWRYLVAGTDTGKAAPDQTMTFASVAGHKLALDVYRPDSKTGEPVPAVIVVHGGGWSAGDKGETPRASRWLAQHGFAVFDVQYRLSPSPNWRAAIGDVKCAIGWVKAHAAAAGVNLDRRRVAVLGRSAGGHLALLAAYTSSDAALGPSCPVTDTAVSAVVAFYAPTDLVWGYENPANVRVYDTSQKLRDFLGGTPTTAPDAYRLASITTRVHAKAPRTLLIHGGRDQFVSAKHVDRLVPRLKLSGIPHEALVVGYGQHGFDYVFGGMSGQIVELTLLKFLNADAPPPPPKEKPKVVPPLAPG
jgi:acetyl esterase/lipase